MLAADVHNYSKMILSLNQIAKILGFEPHPTTFKKLIFKLYNKKSTNEK